MFSPATIEAIKCYVYALADEKDQIFYIGKGTGNRVFAHVAEARSLSRSEPVLDHEDTSEFDDAEAMPLKLQRIVELQAMSPDLPRQYILREGLSDEEALMLEATLISVLDWQFNGLLTNQMAGAGSKHFGLKSTTELEATKGEPFRLSDLPGIENYDRVMAININRRWPEVADGKASLLEVSTGKWTVNLSNASQCPYAIIHANGVVRGVFRISHWVETPVGGKTKYSFVAADCAELLQARFRNKNAASLFGPLGNRSQSPIRYVQVPR